MSEVIFCKTRYQDIGYASYNDFWRLVELAGYPVIYVDQLEPHSDNTYIVTPLNDEWLAGWQSPRARIIHYELEWRTDWRAEVNEPSGVAEVWACDKHYAERIGARYVPMGGDCSLNYHSEHSTFRKEYDVAQFSYQTARRQIITQQLQANGLILAPNEGLWGMVRSTKLMQSKVCVHIHQTEQGNGVAPLRWCLAAAHGLPIISETVPDCGIFGHTHMLQSDYAHIAQDVSQLLNPVYRYGQELEDKARNLHGLLCHDWTFRRCIEASV